MINNEILSFIKEQLAQGTTKDKVKDMLVGQGGWDEKDVEEAFETISFSGTSYPSVLKNAEALAIKNDEIGEKNKSLKEKDAFAPASELMKSVSSAVRPTIFSPGLSHIEQPKSMEPSMPGSSFSSNAVSSPQISVEQPVKVVSVDPRPRDTGTNNTMSNALAGLRERIASGVSAPAPVSEPVSVFHPTIQPVIKEPVVSSSPYPQPVVTASGNSSTSVGSVLPASGNGGSVFPRQVSPSQGAGQSAAPSPMSFLKTAAPSTVPSLKSSAQPLQPMAVFPKNQFGGGLGTHMSPTPAQLAALQQKKGGRFLLGFMMFLIGLALGGISMNAYMKGFINTTALNGIIEKGMDMIGLGTISIPTDSEPALPAEAPADATAP
jgi:hypothetical protein